jgi:hypothetical protein
VCVVSLQVVAEASDRTVWWWLTTENARLLLDELRLQKDLGDRAVRWWLTHRDGRTTPARQIASAEGPGAQVHLLVLI